MGFFSFHHPRNHTHILFLDPDRNSLHCHVSKHICSMLSTNITYLAFSLSTRPQRHNIVKLASSLKATHTTLATQIIQHISINSTQLTHHNLTYAIDPLRRNLTYLISHLYKSERTHLPSFIT